MLMALPAPDGAPAAVRPADHSLPTRRLTVHLFTRIGVAPATLGTPIPRLMAPLAHGATCLVRPLQQLGLVGSSSFDAALFHAAES